MTVLEQLVAQDMIDTYEEAVIEKDDSADIMLDLLEND